MKALALLLLAGCATAHDPRAWEGTIYSQDEYGSVIGVARDFPSAKLCQKWVDQASVFFIDRGEVVILAECARR